MLILAIITGLIGLFCGIMWVINYKSSNNWEGGFWWGAGFWTFGTIWLVAFLLSLNLKVSEQNLSGYIYSHENRVGFTTAHIRFSEQAGTDVQPQFCTKTDSEAGRKIQELSGSGKKVRITIQPYFYFSNNPFACGTTNMTIEATDPSVRTTDLTES